MATITLFKANLENLTIEEVCRRLNGKKVGDNWLSAKPSKYNEHEAFIQYWHYEDIEKTLKKVLDDTELEEAVSVLKKNGKEKVLKRVYAFINTLTSTLEIYSKARAEEVREAIAKFLSIGFEKLILTPADLANIEQNHSLGTKTYNDKKLVLRPKIKYLNDSRYCITLMADSNELRFGKHNIFQFRPRFEIRQIVSQIAATKGLLKEVEQVKVA